MGKGGSIILGAAIVVAAACSGASRASSPAAPAASISTTTTTKPAPAVSFDGTVAAPALVNTGTDYVKIVQSLVDHGNWLGAHRPDPTLAQDTVAPGTRLFANYVDDLTYLRDHDLRIVEKRSAPTTVTILSSTKDAFSARLVEHISVHQIFDRAGRLTRQRRFVGTTTYLDVVVLAHDP